MLTLVLAVGISDVFMTSLVDFKSLRFVFTVSAPEADDVEQTELIDSRRWRQMSKTNVQTYNFIGCGVLTGDDEEY